MRDSYAGCLGLIMIVAVLAFAASFLGAQENAVVGVLGMGFSVVVSTLALVGLLLGGVWEELSLLTERKRKRLEAERRAQTAKREAERQAMLDDWERRNRVWVDPDAMQITPEDVTAQRKADWRQWRETWRGRWARFWNGVRRRITRMIGEENEILIELAYGILKTLACLAPFVAIAAAAIVVWSLL